MTQSIVATKRNMMKTEISPEFLRSSLDLWLCLHSYDEDNKSVSTLVLFAQLQYQILNLEERT